ncbi:Clr5 domain-containing protein [Phyllosticta capitalensis]|uniref:Clr5 domain-containing protein n=1 Tax=Phyllosticta capitalensis TaxID=121624 RepID=A0ABR1YBH1_9PEZI
MASTWESHKETIRGLYLVQNKSQKQVMAEMAKHHNFSATAAQYERQLKSWRFRKNLTAKEWACVARRVEKRKSEGRASKVFVNGKHVPEEKVRKKTSKYGFQTRWEKETARFRGQLTYHLSPKA